MKLKEWLYKLFYFNKQERNGVFVLCSIIIVLVIAKLSLPLWAGNNNDVKLIAFTLPEENKTENSSFNPEHKIEEKNISTERFVFNPNTITTEEALKLGFSKKTATTLINYRTKGGKFFKAEDLKKLYGISASLYESLEPYILIPHSEKHISNHFTKYDTSYTKQNTFVKYEKKNFSKEPIDINTADSLAIVYLKGIGPAFTKRIIKYRTMLGGFHSINQLREVYGMTDSLFTAIVPQITINKNTITKIPINAIDFNSLRKHPYFNYASAQAIVNFKFKHGKLTEQDVRNLGIFSEEKLNVILPYLSY